MSLYRFSNNPTGAAVTTLSAGIDASVTSLTLAANVTTLPSAGSFDILIGSELIHVGARSTVTLSSLTRGYGGTTAAAHTAGDSIYNPLTAEGLLANPGPMTTSGDMVRLNASLRPERVTGGLLSGLTAGRILLASGAAAVSDSANLSFANDALGVGDVSAIVPAFNSFFGLATGTTFETNFSADGIAEGGLIHVFIPKVLPSGGSAGIGYAEQMYSLYNPAATPPIRNLYSLDVAGDHKNDGTTTFRHFYIFDEVGQETKLELQTTKITINADMSFGWWDGIPISSPYQLATQDVAFVRLGPASLKLTDGAANLGSLTANAGIFSALSQGGKSLTLSGNLTTTGAFNITLAAPSSSTWNLPSGGGTLANLDSIQAFTNKTGTISQWTNDANYTTLASVAGVGYLTSVTAHNLLSATHGDTLSDAVVRGDLIYGNATPKWARLPKPSVLSGLSHDGTDVSWVTATGTGAPVRAAGAVLSTPTLGAASATSINFGTSLLINDASDVLSQRNGTTAQTLHIYRTFTDASNYRRAVLNSTGLGSQAAGSGSAYQFALRDGANGDFAYFPISANGASATFDVIIGNLSGSVPTQGAMRLVSGNMTHSSGNFYGVNIPTGFTPAATSTMVAIPLRIAPTINYQNGTPGAGSYEALKIAVTETALPTGQNYLLRASAGAAGTTDKFTVTNAGAAMFASTLTTLGGATFHTTSSALTDGAGASAGTIANAPAIGNPTKWIGINDNGTTRYIPAW